MISIIIPVYNVSNYIRECLNSVKNQSFTNWECILIDDGSIDDSGRICDKYAEYDKRFRVIHQKNQGLTAVRNLGLREAKGDFLAWVDSDDIVHPRWLETLYNTITNNPCDISAVGYLNCSDGTIQIEDNLTIEKAAEIPKEQLIPKLYNNEISPNVWSKLYRKQFIGTTVFVLEKGEDWDFNLQLFLKEARVFQTQTPLYYYRHRKDSITRGYDFSFQINDLITKCDIYKHYLEIELDKNYRNLILNKLYRQLLDIKNYEIRQNIPDAWDNNTIYNEVFRRTYHDFIKCNETPAKFKNQIKLLYYFPSLYIIIYKIMIKFRSILFKRSDY